jgi:hypothetical protein
LGILSEILGILSEVFSTPWGMAAQAAVALGLVAWRWRQVQIKNS